MAEGLAWYGDAHRFAVRLGDRYRIGTDAAAGVIAALSPQLSWERNRHEADRFLREGRAAQTRNAVGKAGWIACGAAPLEILGGSKVRSFYSNIADPTGSDAVTIDRHALDVARGYVGDDKGRRVLERPGAYQAVADAYRAAGRCVGARPLDVQAVVWVAWRNRRVAEQGYRGRSKALINV